MALFWSIIGPDQVMKGIVSLPHQHGVRQSLAGAAFRDMTGW